MKTVKGKNRQRQALPRTKLFMVFFVITLLLVVANQVFVNVYSEQDQVYSEKVSDLRVLSQELAKNASSISSGNSLVFSALEKSKNDFEAAWYLVNYGRSAYIDTGVGIKTTLPGKSELISNYFPGIQQTWNAVSNNVSLIMDNQEQILQINSLANDIINDIPSLQREYDEVVNTLLDNNEAVSTTAVAQRQAWLAERIALNLNLIVSGESSSQQVEQFQRDINLFQINHESLLEGDRTLGISQITDSEARERLETITSIFNTIRSQSNDIIAAVPDINASNNAVIQIISSSEMLLTNISQLDALFASQTVLRFASPIVGYALLMVLLIIISMYGKQVIRQSKQAEKIAAEENKRNNEAVLKLLDEISSLGDGDLTVEATVSEDFTGAIADSINYAVGQLRELVSAITSVTLEVSSSTKSSEKNVQYLSEASARQSESIDSVYNSIREIGGDINLVSKNAQKSLDVARNSVQIASGGAEVVKDTIKGMDSIRDQIQDTAKRIKRLGESSQEIGGFVALINDIAEHTNTLSLNAAIQAAMAGDAGKGFGVVADEVQALAERSSDATRQIESLVKVIQGDINEAVKSMEQTTSEVVSGTRLAKSAGEALDDIESVSIKLAKLVDSITEASRNQTKAASELTDSMEVIQQVTHKTSSGITATSRFMSKLGELTERLQSTVAGFSLSPKITENEDLEDENVTRMDSKAVFNFDDPKDKKNPGKRLNTTPKALSA